MLSPTSLPSEASCVDWRLSHPSHATTGKSAVCSTEENEPESPRSTNTSSANQAKFPHKDLGRSTSSYSYSEKLKKAKHQIRASVVQSGIGNRKKTILQDDHLRDKAQKIKAESVRYRQQDTPWLADDGETLLWSFPRICAARMIRQQMFEAFMGVVIMFNFVLICYETDYEAQCYPTYSDDPDTCPFKADDISWLNFCSNALLVMYTAEVILRLYVERHLFLWNRWNVLDLFIVLAGWFSSLAKEFISVDVAFLRTFRTLRLLRGFRIILSVRELYLLVHGLVYAMNTIFFGVIMLFFLLMMWSILLVEYVHPINANLHYPNCARCSRAYKTVMQSVLTLFQTVVTGDDWGRIGVSVIERSPWTVVLLSAIVVSVTLGMMNLILAVIVERAVDARNRDVEDRSKRLLVERAAQKLQLLDLCAVIDENNDKRLSFEEIQTAFHGLPEFKDLMNMLEIRDEDLDEIFRILDVDGSGDVSYEEFVHELYALKTCNQNLMLAVIRRSMGDVMRDVQEIRQSHLPAKELKRDIEEIKVAMHRNSSMLERHEHIQRSTEESNEFVQRGPQDGSSGVRSESTSTSLIQDVQKMQNSWLELAALHERFAIQMEEQTALIARHHMRHAAKKGKSSGARDSMEVPELEQVEAEIAKELISKGPFEFSRELHDRDWNAQPNERRAGWQSADVDGELKFSGALSDSARSPSHRGGSPLDTGRFQPVSSCGYSISTPMELHSPPIVVGSQSEAHGMGPEPRVVPAERFPCKGQTIAT